MCIVCISVIKEESLPPSRIAADCVTVHLHAPNLPSIISYLLPSHILADMLLDTYLMALHIFLTLQVFCHRFLQHLKLLLLYQISLLEQVLPPLVLFVDQLRIRGGSIP